MDKDKERENRPLREVIMRPEDVLDQAVYEDTWLALGDDKEVDVSRLIRQGRIDYDKFNNIY